MEEKETFKSYALWGTGEVDNRASVALLEDYLPKEGLGAIIHPTSVGRGSLRSVVNWLEGDDQLGENGTIGSDDLVRDLLEIRAEEGDDLVFIALWPTNPTKEDIALVESAMASGIPVLDLCAALDELVITDEMREASEPVTEKPKRETKKAREAREAAESEAKIKEALELEIAKAAEIAKGMESRGQEMIVQTEALDIQGMPELVSDPWVEVGVPLDAIRKIFREEIERAFREFGFERPRVHVGTEVWVESPVMSETFTAPKTKGTLSAMADEVPVTSPKEPLPEDDGSIPFDGPYTDGKLAYYMTEDGGYRRANGKPRRGEVEIHLNDAEVRQLRESSQLK
jgi:hypothetical protein